MHELNPGHVAPVLDGIKIFSVAFKVASRSKGLTPRNAPSPGRETSLPNGAYLMCLPLPPPQGTKEREGFLFIWKKKVTGTWTWALVRDGTNEWPLWARSLPSLYYVIGKDVYAAQVTGDFVLELTPCSVDFTSIF